MNALANSQDEELRKFLEHGYGEGKSPVRFARYTGQEQGELREQLRRQPPDILLTNYMMLELLLTRVEDRRLVEAAQGLRFLVFDELHTYRGRQGADVALLIRRCRLAFGDRDLVCVGTSATMASGGSMEEQRQEVAGVAGDFFGEEFQPDQVIGETLERATREFDFEDPEVLARLRRAVADGEEPPEDPGEFCAHPLASWIESMFGVRREPATGQLVRREPRPLRGDGPEGRKGVAQELAEKLGQDPERCYRALRRFLVHGARLRRDESSRFPVFAFRLHQFFTRGDTVWATLETGNERHLEPARKATKPGDPGRPLFPLVFCRHCGTPYYRVSIVEEGEGRLLLPREDREEETEGEPGYLYLSEDHPWPSPDDPSFLERLPAHFKEITSGGKERVKPELRGDLPERVFVDPAGRLVPEGRGRPAALVHGYFHFCLHPDCGVVHAKTQRAERSKLATLGVDNRSTATTILALRTLIELNRREHGLRQEARKLLSFTDNRQDASLQAGHFNDFVQVARLRSGLYRALMAVGEEGLSSSEVPSRVFQEMNLPFEEYASDPDVEGFAREATRDALVRVITYFLFRDLQRGWRVTAPNLEDCGLLRFDYAGLEGRGGLLEKEEIWREGLQVRRGRETVEVEAPAALRVAPDDVREEILRTLLDVMRHRLAIKTEILELGSQRKLLEATHPRLREDTVWYLPQPDELVHATVIYPRSRRPGDPKEAESLSSYSAFGKYVKRRLGRYHDGNLRREDVDEIIRYLLLALKKFGIVEEVREGRGDGIPGYQVQPEALRWLPGDGRTRPIDRTRLIEAGEAPPEVNRYFVEYYRSFVEVGARLEAREHTAQVQPEARVEREERFRSAELPLLFCSPTMELGVDISQLNVVNMRNVPPTPANYAQRSGRAGRGGQPALVFTYCAGRSPHDQYFFRKPARMVAGIVSPPRIDLANQDLLRAHVHAIWMEVARPDLGKTLAEILELDRKDRDGQELRLPLKESVLAVLRDGRHREEALRRARKLVAALEPRLGRARWYHDGWVEEVLGGIEQSFEAACERWRSLYRAAKRQRELQHRIWEDRSRTEVERRQAQRLRAQAETQIQLLTSAEGMFEGDFYSYRYFAAEGFLPGYNFPRLPISAYVPARRRTKGRDEFVSRPRFLAISEFGPRALVYHEGASYRVHRVNLDLDPGLGGDSRELPTAVMKRCRSCGYAHLDEMLEQCQRCGEPLGGETRIENLVRMQNVSLRVARRITCDEEERQRFGYRIVTAYRFPLVGDREDRQDATVEEDGATVLSLHYGSATTLYRVNLGWKRQAGSRAPGFELDLETGFWARNRADETDRDDPATSGRIQRVVPFVEDTKNALVVRPAEPLPRHVMASLESALRQAILRVYQLEPRELAWEPMPDREERREILLYEASEGGAGVLRQLVDDPTALPRVARAALEVCHYDPDTLEDVGAETCGRACYECLLDYGNQPDHRELDRGTIRDLLARLARADCRPAGGMGSREERLEELLRLCDSELERKWLRLVDRLGLRLPSDAQHPLRGVYTRPDFYYRDHHVAIYIDGPVHDEPARVGEDEKLDRELMDLGYTVLRFRHDEDWERKLREHPDVFGTPRG